MNEAESANPFGPEIIAPEVFQDLIGSRAKPLLLAAGYLVRHTAPESVMTRPLVGKLLSEATQMEELLDAYGARTNRRWHRFRSLVAAIKRFADAGYELLHILHVCPSYRLLPIRQDFVAATSRALAFTNDIVLRGCAELLDEARNLAVPVPTGEDTSVDFGEQLAPGRLPRDRRRRKMESVSRTMTRLSTAFLNVASESKMVHAAREAAPEDRHSFVPDPICEESLRYLRHRMHNLQSAYDTWVAETEAEDADADMLVLRGHTSVVFHLLQTATAFAHYYERHTGDDEDGGAQALVDRSALLEALMGYSITFVSHYLECAQFLCRVMLKRYTEIGQTSVSVPRYRGFHVRPSTLVAKIVLHYGSEVKMEIEGEQYDASTPFEIFRANERINFQKRRQLANEIASLPPIQDCPDDGDVRDISRRVVMTLAERGRLVIYEQPLQLREPPASSKGKVLERVIDEVVWLQSSGKIDVKCEMNISFIGDTRALADLELLAANGYGEDNLGNNISLPSELAYLRR